MRVLAFAGLRARPRSLSALTHVRAHAGSLGCALSSVTPIVLEEQQHTQEKKEVVGKQEEKAKHLLYRQKEPLHLARTCVGRKGDKKRKRVEGGRGNSFVLLLSSCPWDQTKEFR